MGIRPQADIDEETRKSAFEDALSAREEEEASQESEKTFTVPESQDDEVEIVDGDPPDPEEEANKSDTESNLLGRLVDALEKRETPRQDEPAPPQRAQAQPVDMEALRKKFNEKLHETDDPFSLVQESAEALVGGVLAQQSREIQTLKRDAMKADPINSMIFEKWGNEVETVIAGLPANQQNHPDAYQFAVTQVRDKHFMEILNAQVEERVSAKLKPGHTPGLGETSNASLSSTTKRKTRKVYASPQDKAEAKRYGLSVENYLRSRGKI